MLILPDGMKIPWDSLVVMDDIKKYAMEEKLFLKLKEKYADFGLGDDVLKEYAKSACSFFAFKDEDVLDFYVISQEGALKAIQRNVSRRVTEALKKVTVGDSELKTRLAASVFTTLAEHKGCGVIESLIQDTVRVTNNIFKGIIYGVEEDKGEL